MKFSEVLVKWYITFYPFLQLSLETWQIFGPSNLCWNVIVLACGPVAESSLDKILVGRKILSKSDTTRRCLPCLPWVLCAHFGCHVQGGSGYCYLMCHDYWLIKNKLFYTKPPAQPEKSPLWCEPPTTSDNSSCPILSCQDTQMLWQSANFMMEAIDQSSQRSDNSTTTQKVFDFLLHLLEKTDVFLPLDIDRFSSTDKIYFVPSLLSQASSRDVWTYKSSESWVSEHRT